MAKIEVMQNELDVAQERRLAAQCRHCIHPLFLEGLKGLWQVGDGGTQAGLVRRRAQNCGTLDSLLQLFCR